MNLNFTNIQRSCSIKQNLNKTASDWLFTSKQGVEWVKKSLMVVTQDFRVGSTIFYIFSCQSNCNLGMQ